MGDSDDEYDRKRRDKFRGERAEAAYRGPERIPRPRDDWVERDSWSRPRPREYRAGMRERGYSPSMDSAPKRMRHDYYGDNYYSHYPSYHQQTHREPQTSAQNDAQQPPMMSFKSFLATQDDNISESEAIEKYNDYKLEFQRQQLNEFFVAHKDEEWFKLKYHPEESVKRKEEQMASLKKRLEVFMELFKSGLLNNISVDCVRTNEVLKLLDTVVIKLEGGSEEDLALLEQEYSELEEKTKEQKIKTENEQKDSLETKNDSAKSEMETNANGDEQPNGVEKDETTNDSVQEKNGADDEEKNIEENNDENKMETDEKVDERELTEKKDDNEEKEEEKRIDKDEDSLKNTDEKETKDTKVKKDKKRKRSYSGSTSSSSSSSGSEDEKEKEQPKEEEEVEKDVKPNIETEIKIEVEEDKSDKPKSLHKTTSIFLRNLPPTISKQEVEATCSKYNGFLRVALADPQPERRWLRRGWVTFKRDANIKEICWNLNNMRLRECELGAIVNRDLSRRIRPVNGIMAHKQVVRSDIGIAARVVLHLDSKSGLWPDDEERNEQSFGLKSNNPVLHNITDYLIEEASAEEEELLGLEPAVPESSDAAFVDRDDTLIGVLDRIIFYLRIVHSVDYYNHCEYPNEDEMPNRCGILHARGPPPNSKMDLTLFIGPPIEAKMAAFLPEKKTKDDNKNEAKLINVSIKDVETEIDKFVQANTRELAKDKWLCPLSGKKFKGPDFVRKHIFNKHAEQIEMVKKDVEFFNNYLRDPKRPMLAEAPLMTKRDEPAAQSYNHSNNYGGYGGGGGYGGYNRTPAYYNQGFAPRSRGYTPRQRGGPTDYRPVVHYRDLDAPREPEELFS